MITIVTATYNRASTIPRLYSSLCAQSCLEFEWVVVDDGSVDDTPKLLNEISEASPFPIRVIQQKNGGKHVALNTGAQNALTPWILIVDSDDALVTSAVQTVITEIQGQADRDVVGWCYRKAFFDMRLVGARIDQDNCPKYLSPTEAGHLFKGDLAYVFKTALLLRYKFPVFGTEKFVPELYIWNKIGDEGHIRIHGNTVIYLCDYLEDGYSNNFSSNLRKNPIGFLTFYWSQIARERSFFYKVKYAIRSIQCCIYVMLKRFS